jgi:hypothetical protein
VRTNITFTALSQQELVDEGLFTPSTAHSHIQTSTMATETQKPLPLWEEKISIEPDLGDQRQSTYKALPSPPKTPKRVLMKYRFSGVFPLLLSLASFVLTLVVVLAGQNSGTFQGQYLVTVRTMSVMLVRNEADEE